MTPQQFLKSYLKDEDGCWNCGCDIVANSIAEVSYAQDLNIEVSSPELKKGLKTGWGIITDVFSDYPGFFGLLRNGVNDAQLCFVKERRKPHSLLSLL